MAKFHVNTTTGNVAQCRATKKPCPLGADTPHFTSREEASRWYEKQGTEKETSLTTHRRKSKAEAQAEALPVKLSSQVQHLYRGTTAGEVRRNIIKDYEKGVNGLDQEEKLLTRVGIVPEKDKDYTYSVNYGATPEATTITAQSTVRQEYYYDSNEELPEEYEHRPLLPEPRYGKKLKLKKTDLGFSNREGVVISPRYTYALPQEVQQEVTANYRTQELQDAYSTATRDDLPAWAVLPRRQGEPRRGETGWERNTAHNNNLLLQAQFQEAEKERKIAQERVKVALANQKNSTPPAHHPTFYGEMVKHNQRALKNTEKVASQAKEKLERNQREHLIYALAEHHPSQDYKRAVEDSKAWVDAHPQATKTPWHSAF